MNDIVLVAGATGNLGERIVHYLLKTGAQVRAVVRNTVEVQKIDTLKKQGVEVFIINQWNLPELTAACQGVTCVVSALAGLREVIIDAQTVLLDAAIAAGVPRFIPSDYSLDFTKFSHGENRNLDLRREFHKYLDKSPIAATTIFNGAFADLLTGEMPMILDKQKLLLYWGHADHHLGFTTIENTAAYTALAAVDDSTPRYLHILGDSISPREIKGVVSEVTGKKFRLFRPGGQKLLGFIIKMARKMAPGENELYPAWQGMQYMHNMIDKRLQIERLDNDRYPGIQWETVKDVLEKHRKSRGY